MLDHVTGLFVFYSPNIDPDVWPLSANETSHDQLDSGAHSDQSIIALDTQQSTSTHDPHSWIPSDMTDDISFSQLSYATPEDWHIEPQNENGHVSAERGTPTPDHGQVLDEMSEFERPYFLRHHMRLPAVESSPECDLQYDRHLKDYVYMPRVSYNYVDPDDFLSVSDFKSESEESSGPEPYESEISNDSWLR